MGSCTTPHCKRTLPYAPIQAFSFKTVTSDQFKDFFTDYFK